ncbi:unnamed protein product [Darwinula stevensoni]|uniref:CS domain-containing protein n=1 Tax=Darwinula stevensoni TaxID=69355 RepID=A0A7R9A058_9CRUS|nr:unnamed protein product [Darwinula stevensoni]CAG0883939.1 unnamed protein product [Darwinula stevensoni]
MPILVKASQWMQTDTHVKVIVRICSGPVSRRNILYSSEYIKMNSPPFLFEAFLPEKIDVDESEVVVVGNDAHFLLKKCHPSHWDCLDQILPREEQMKRRRAAEEVELARLLSQSKAIRDERGTISKEAVRLQLCQEEKQHLCVQKMKDKQISMFFKAISIPEIHEKSKPAEKETEYLEAQEVIMPPPRDSAKILMKFSPYDLLTPKRESVELMRHQVSHLQ